VHLRDGNGRQYQRTFRTKKAAEEFEAKELADRARGSWVDPRGAATPFGTLAGEWLTSNPAKRPSGWARDETIVRLHLRPVFENRPIGTITKRDVQALVNEWASGSKKPSTIARQYGVLRAILNYAVDCELIGKTPCRGVNLPEGIEKDAHIVDADELAALAASMDDHTRPMVFLGAVLGLRWGECAGLKVGRIDFLRSEIRVCWQRTRGPGGVMVEGPPKSKKGNRTEAAPKELMDLLAEHLAWRGLSGADTDAYVFTSPAGEPLDYSNWYHNVWVAARHRVRLYDLKFHNLRDANSTAMVEGGVDVKTAQHRLGHADVRTTLEIYTKATTDGNRRAADVLGQKFMRRQPDASGDQTATDVG
jgi:integrase